MERVQEDKQKIIDLLDRVAPNRLTLKVKDIMELFGCSESFAYKIIREAKSISDIANAKGFLTKTDFIRWYFRREALST